MKRIYILLLLTTVLFGACKKDDAKNAKGTLTAKIDLYDDVTKKWKGNEDFTATEVKTTKSGNDYTVKAKDAAGTSFTLIIKNITGTGKFQDVDGELVKAGVTYNSVIAGTVTVTEATSKTLKATFIFEGQKWSVNNGVVDASF